MKKRFLFGFLMMAMIVLLSGMIQGNNAVERSAPLYALDNSPPNIQPVVIKNAEVSQSIIVTWLCASMPGVINYDSSNINLIMNEDMLSMHTILYNDYDSFYKISQIGHINIFKYRLPRDGLREN